MEEYFRFSIVRESGAVIKSAFNLLPRIRIFDILISTPKMLSN